MGPVRRRARPVAAVLAACLVVAVARGVSAAPFAGVIPGEDVPEFTLTTLNGTSLSVSSDASDLFPLFLAFLDPHDAFSLRSWSSRDSLRGFLETAPVEATYVFLSHGDSPEDDVAKLRTTLNETIVEMESLLPADSPAIARLGRLWPRLHFSSSSPADLTLLPLRQWVLDWTDPRPLAKGWPSPQGTGEGALFETSHATATAAADYSDPLPPPLPPAPLESTRLDAAKDWNPFSVSGIKGPAVDGWAPSAARASDASGDTSRLSAPLINGTVLFLELPLPGERPGVAGLAYAAQKEGAKAVVFYPQIESDPLYDVRCEGEECDLPVMVPTTSVPRSFYVQLFGSGFEPAKAGRAAVDADGRPPAGALADADGQPFAHAGVDADGRPLARALRSVGSRPADSAAQRSSAVLPPSLAPPTVSFEEAEGPSLYLSADRHGRAAEVGWLSFATLKHVAWASQWEQYQRIVDESLSGWESAAHRSTPFEAVEEDQRLAETLAANGRRSSMRCLPDSGSSSASSKPLKSALRATRSQSNPARESLAVFRGDAAFDGSGRLRTTVEVPASFAEPRLGERIFVEMRLGCQGPKDADCPQWDHVVQSFVCCGDECESCPDTVWTPPHADALDASAFAVSGPRWGAAPADAGPSDDLSSLSSQRDALRNGSTTTLGDAFDCGPELARWITPFRRRIGRWVTDVTAIAPILRGALEPSRVGHDAGASPRAASGRVSGAPAPPAQCTFTLQTPGWAGPWVPKLKLHRVHAAAVAPGSDLELGAAERSVLAHQGTVGALGPLSDAAAERGAGSSWAALATSPPRSPSSALRSPLASLFSSVATFLSSTHSSLFPATLYAPLARRREDAAPGGAVRESRVLGGRGGDDISVSSSTSTSPPRFPRAARVRATASRQAIPLSFAGGDFDASYNARQTPAEFSIPASFSRARLVATITGHGSDENNCAEFCPTEHVFEIAVLSIQGDGKTGAAGTAVDGTGGVGVRSKGAGEGLRREDLSGGQAVLGRVVVSTVVSRAPRRALPADPRAPLSADADIPGRSRLLSGPLRASAVTLGTARNVSLSFDVAGTEWGCTSAVLAGSVPNEHGTWEYGRGGWCDGAPVPATVWDVTQAIRAQVDDGSGADPPASGELAIRASYWGLYKGATPRPLAPRPGAIIISAYLVVDA